jgi:hypothetical protein
LGEIVPPSGTSTLSKVGTQKTTPYTQKMVSRATIKTLVDESEAKYQECWETLSRLAKPQGAEGAKLFDDMLEFQPTLTRALYDLGEMHRTLH